MRIISNFEKSFFNLESSCLVRLLGFGVKIVDFPQWVVDFPQVEVCFG